MMGLFDEFKEFAVKGNVIDMAVGVIIGGAFGKIVTSFVNDIIMPGLSAITGKINITDLAISFSPADGAEPINIGYGLFLQNIIDFFIVAVCLFFAIKAVNILNKKKTLEEPINEPPTISVEQALLTEIRDILQERK